MAMAIQILIWGSLALPLLLGLLFRAGAPHLFFSLMAGELLARYFGHDIAKFAESSIPEKYGNATGEIVLLVAPMLLTAFFMRKTVKNSKVPLHIIPYAITGLVLAAFLFPLLPTELQSQIGETYVGGWILNLNRSIIGGVVVLQVVSLWLFNREERHGKHGH